MATLEERGLVEVSLVLGAVFLLVVQEMLWTNIPIFRSHLHLATYGIILALVGLLMPNGFANTRPVRSLLNRLGLAGYG